MKKIFLIMIFFWTINFLFAQEEEETIKYWITVGCWVDRDIATNISYSFSLGDNFYKVGYLSKGDSFPFRGFGSDNILIRSVDISFGKRLQSDWFQLALFIGPSYVFGKKLLQTDKIEKFNSIGLEADIQLLFRLANEVGIGAGLYGNLNSVKNYIGINVNLTIGNGK